MSAELELHEDIVSSIVLEGDLSGLTPHQLVGYYYHRCALLKIDPGEKPFDLLRLNGKLMLYVTKAGAAALTRVNQIDVKIVDREMVDGLCIHTARASLPCGRGVDDVGVVALSNLGGEKLANAIMKSATKAKRRAVIGLCGQGLVDESELDSISGRVERLSISQVEAEARGERPVLPPATDEPRCSGKMQPVADAIRARRTEFANIVDAHPDDVWRKVCGRIGVPAAPNGGPPEPERLSKTHGLAASELLTKWIEAKRPAEVVDGPPADVEQVDPTAEDAP